MKNEALFSLAVLVVTWGAVLPGASEKPAVEVASSAQPAVPPEKETNTQPALEAPPLPVDLARPAPAPSSKVSDERITHGIREIVNMVEQGIEPDIIQSYIENSGIAYNPSVNEILYLHKQGVPSDLISTIIRHGGKVRAQQAQAVKEMQEKFQEKLAEQQAAAQAPAPAPAAAAPAPAPQPAAPSYYPTPVYVPSYPTYVYNSYPIYPINAYRPARPVYPVYSRYSACSPSASLYRHYRPYYTVYPRYSFGTGFGSSFCPTPGLRGGSSFKFASTFKFRH